MIFTIIYSVCKYQLPNTKKNNERGKNPDLLTFAVCIFLKFCKFWLILEQYPVYVSTQCLYTEILLMERKKSNGTKHYKSANQTAGMRNLVCSFVVRKHRRQIFSRRGPRCKKAKSVVNHILCFMRCSKNKKKSRFDFKM